MFLNRSFVDFEIGNESVGRDLEENGHFPIRKCVARGRQMGSFQKGNALRVIHLS